MGVVKKKGKAERSDDTEQQSATLEESSSGRGRGRGKRWTGLMLWIHGPGGVGDEVPFKTKKGAFENPGSSQSSPQSGLARASML